MNVWKDKGQLAPSTMTGFEAAGVANQADALLDRAQEADREQSALVEASTLPGDYKSALAAQLEEKVEQVGRIEDRLEAMIEAQSSRLMDAQSHPPGLFSKGSTRQKWQEGIQRQQAAIQRLQGRLEAVREIKEGMGVTGPKIEELAAQKLRQKQPLLVEGWEELREAQRRHEAHFRRLQQQEGQKRKHSSANTLSLNMEREK